MESLERKDVYCGVAVVDADGQATIEFPVWFEALNEIFRCQLTPIGARAAGLHISRELAESCFGIAGGDPRMEVCWQVIGMRRDAWALAHPLIVGEAQARKERGCYLHPGRMGDQLSGVSRRSATPS